MALEVAAFIKVSSGDQTELYLLTPAAYGIKFGNNFVYFSHFYTTPTQQKAGKQQAIGAALRPARASSGSVP